MSFDIKSKDWDKSSKRVQTALSIGEAIAKKFALKDKKILDFGCGTGLLSTIMVENGAHVVGLDNSKGMLKEFDKKFEGIKEVSSCLADVEHLSTEALYDGVVSSMTLHHIKEPKVLVEKLHGMIKEEGFIAIADLVSEDGNFHGGKNEGVHHFGFSHDELEEIFTSFGGVSIEVVAVIEKEAVYEVFLASAQK